MKQPLFFQKAFTLIEVVIATAIVGMAISSTFNVFYTVRRLNTRAHFYAAILPFVREEMNSYVTSHNFIKTPVNRSISLKGIENIRYTVKGKADSGFPRCQKVTMKFTFRDSTSFEHFATFQSYISRDIVNNAGEE